MLINFFDFIGFLITFGVNAAFLLVVGKVCSKVNKLNVNDILVGTLWYTIFWSYFLFIDVLECLYTYRFGPWHFIITGIMTIFVYGGLRIIFLALLFKWKNR